MESCDCLSASAPLTQGILIAVALTLTSAAAVHRLLYSLEAERGLKYACFNLLQSLPLAKSIIKHIRGRVVADIGRLEKAKNARVVTVLQGQGNSVDTIMAECSRALTSDSIHTDRMSGAIYISPQSEAFRLCASVYAMFAHTNPLHGDAFPSVCQMEAEVVSIVAHLLGSTFDEQICGNMTSGGTESILSAIRTSRDYMRKVRGISRPEMIAAISAHAAVYKAADYFNIKLVLIGTDEKGRLSISELKRKMNKNVILVYASAPSYPHGVIDDVESISQCVKVWKCCLHVDACLGGFVLPFIDASTSKIPGYPKYHFEIPEVTSMSIDTHKYGCAQKGSSVVLYRNRELRKFQYTAVSSWTGGMYISPSQAGSRSGGLVAQTWAALKYFGRDGYTNQAKDIINASARLRVSISEIYPFEVIGEDVTMVVAWRSVDKKINIYAINDVLGSMGWHLSVLHSPPALHLCLTTANIPSLNSFVSDLRTAVKRVESGQFDATSIKAPIYGMANRMSNTNIVDDLLKDIQDVMDRS